ncbi:MAG: hypothetical protein V4650_10480 [Pseudomonadota bacterium]
MNKLIAIAIAIGLALASAAKADGLACSGSCASDHQSCVARLGTAPSENCSIGYRVCVQRCDPRRSNTAYLDSFASKQNLYRRVGVDKAAVCNNHCALSSRTCVESGNGRSNCRSAQQACEDRCEAS